MCPITVARRESIRFVRRIVVLVAIVILVLLLGAIGLVLSENVGFWYAFRWALDVAATVGLEARELRRIQHELAILMRDSKAVAQDVHRLKRELLTEQGAGRARIDETKRTVDHVTAIVEKTAERLT